MNPILEILERLGMEPTRENIQRIANRIPGYRQFADAAIAVSNAAVDFGGRAVGEMAENPVRGYGNFLRGMGSGLAGLGRFLPGEGRAEQALMRLSGQLAPDEGSAQGSLGRLAGDMIPDLVGADIPLIPGRMAEAEGGWKLAELAAAAPLIPGGMGRRGSAFMRKLGDDISEATKFDLGGNGGATFSTRGENLLETPHYAVAVREGDDFVRPATPDGGINQDDFEEFAEKFADDLAQEGNSIGTWRRDPKPEEIEAGIAQPGQQVVVYDVVRTPPRTEEGYREAMRLARQNNQDAIFDLQGVEEIPAKGPGAPTPDELNYTPEDARLERIRAAGYDTSRPLYHGTAAEFDQPTGELYVSPSTRTANAYAEDAVEFERPGVRYAPDDWNDGQITPFGANVMPFYGRNLEEVGEHLYTRNPEQDLFPRFGDPQPPPDLMAPRPRGGGRGPTPDELNFEPGEKAYSGTVKPGGEVYGFNYGGARAMLTRNTRPGEGGHRITFMPDSGPASHQDFPSMQAAKSAFDDLVEPASVATRQTPPARPPEDLGAPLMGAPYVRPSSAYGDRTYGLFDPDAPTLQATREADPLYAERQSSGKTNPFYEAVARSERLRRTFDADVVRGLKLLEGRPWYELGGLQQMSDPDDFRRWNIIGSAASSQNSVPAEFALASLINFAGKRGVWDFEDAIDLYRQTLGMGPDDPINFLRSQDHFDRARLGLERGLLLPSKAGDIHYNSASWKTPSYLQARLGASDMLATIDTHERRRMWQQIMANENLRRLGREHLTTAQWEAGMRDGVIPIRNRADYETLSGIYEAGANRFGFPTAAAYQAPRWTGGGVRTGLESDPTRTYQELLADQVRYTAGQRGMDTSPAGLRRLLGSVLQGNQLLLPFPGGS